MRLLNVLKTQAASMDASQPVARWGVIDSTNVANMTVRVLLQPEGVRTGWLPIASSMVGNGWGLVHMPVVGTPVFCLPDGGDSGSMVVVGATWTASRTPPTGVLEGELWMVHSSGSKIALTNDGKLTLSDAHGTSLAFTNDGNATLTGNLHVTGAVIAGYGTGDQVGLQSHNHPVPEHAGNSSAPTAGT